MRRWNQVPLSRWDELTGPRRPVAMFKRTPSQPPFNGLDFTYPEDEDNFGFAIVELPNGTLAALVHDAGSPIAGTLLWQHGESDPEPIISAVREIGNLSEAEIEWTLHDLLD